MRGNERAEKKSSHPQTNTHKKDDGNDVNSKRWANKVLNEYVFVTLHHRSYLAICNFSIIMLLISGKIV